MSELPEVRRADCGHGVLLVDTPPAARIQNGIHEQPVYLCEDCRARFNARKVETKPAPVIETKSVESSLEPFVDQDMESLRSNLSAYAEGAKAARASKTEDDCPYDRRTKDGKEWLRGYREAESDGKPTGGA